MRSNLKKKANRAIVTAFITDRKHILRMPRNEVDNLDSEKSSVSRHYSGAVTEQT